MNHDIIVATNSKGSGDWIYIIEGDKTIFEGHNIGVNDLVFLLQRYTSVRTVELTDTQMEEGDY
jgi:hypothetical protein